jgi:cysteine-rich repeat protein
VAATCGDTYTWAGHEECDDGNTDEGDLCSNACVYHGASMPSLASIGYLNGAWMSVSQSGTVYLKESSGCGSFDRIHRVESDGTVTMSFLTNLASKCGGDIVAIDEGTGAEKLIFGGSSGSPYGTFIQTWNSTSGTVDQLFFRAAVAINCGIQGHRAGNPPRSASWKRRRPTPSTARSPSPSPASADPSGHRIAPLWPTRPVVLSFKA